MTADGVRKKILRITSGDITQSELARRMGCSRQYLNEVLQGRRQPAGPILAWLGLRRVVRYVAIDGTASGKGQG